MGTEKKINKKNFKENCNHTAFGYGRSLQNAFFYEWKDTMNGRGWKYCIVAHIENAKKNEVLKAFYDWVVNDIELPYYMRYHYAATDADRKKTPIVLDF